MLKNSRQISKELKLLILKKQKECKTEKQKQRAVIEARTEINKKYGKGWRERYAEKKEETYDEWWSRKNLDGSFAYNNVTEDF